MTDTKISALPAAGSANSAMELPVNDSGTTKKVTSAQLVSSAALAAALNGTIAPLTLTALATPPQVTAVATGGGTLNTNYRYVAIAICAGGTPASAAMTNPVTGVATLSSITYNLLSITPDVPGALLYMFWGTSGPSSGQYIGSCAPGGTVKDIGGTRSVVPAAPTIDTGSAGLPLTGPLTVFTPAFSAQAVHGASMGNAQFGSAPVVPQPFGNTSALGHNVWITGRVDSGGTPHGGFATLGLWDISASSTIVFRGSAGTYQTPVSEGSGYGYITTENWSNSVTAGNPGWVETAKHDFGGNGVDTSGIFATDHDVFGRIQRGVATGEWSGVQTLGARGFTVLSRKNFLGSAVWNIAHDTSTNDIGSVWYHWGYKRTTDTPDMTNFEVAYRGWKPVQNTITAMSWSGSQITLQLTNTHALKAGQFVGITGATGSIRADDFNGSWPVVSDDGTNVVLAAGALNPGTASGFGTATYGGNVFYDGPLAGGTGTLWPMKLTGTFVSTDGPIVPKGYTVATLPSTAATGQVQGARAFVTDATLPTFLGTLTGGGAVVCPVFYNGSAWVSG